MELNSNFKISCLFVCLFWYVILVVVVWFFGQFVCLWFGFLSLQTWEVSCRALLYGAQNSFLGRILPWADDFFPFNPLLSEISSSYLGFKGLVMNDLHMALIPDKYSTIIVNMSRFLLPGKAPWCWVRNCKPVLKGLLWVQLKWV